MSLAVTLVLATARTAIADYISAVLYVYLLMIILYVLMQLLFSFGVRPGYSRYTDAVFNFLRDVCNPYLAIFRRFMPMVGSWDLSPIVAIFVLVLFNSLVVGDLIHG